SDGLCDAGVDPDDDNDGVLDGADTNPLVATICADSEPDGCDDCSVTGADQSGGDPNNDGPDLDGDGICDAGDSDTDGDSFSDADTADTLTYTATLSDNSPLPAWLNFDATTRSFSGVPAGTDLGAIDIRITAD
ncbi:putative Ig domain-containing protein, partial [Klebsiella pneumoniae]|uniref:putative Ig domain-containing protein n=1 Tax=Klebsiella pneumoniae TaxID=573 RepID=UPI003A802C92